MSAESKPLISISCGQFTPDEIALGKAIEQVIRETTDYEPYFAEQQNELDGLTTNILSALERCAGFVAVAHHRGRVQRPDGESVRASVWIEQEIAIAAFIQHALKRRIEVVLYLQKGIRREGIREQLRLAPVEFETQDDVLNHFRQRARGWRLTTAPRAALEAEWKVVEADTRSGERHEYRLGFDLVNKGDKLLTDWRIQVEIPTEFTEFSHPPGILMHEEDSTTRRPDEAKIYPGQRIQKALVLAYFVDAFTHDLIERENPMINVSVWSGDAPPWRVQIPLADVNEF